MGIQINGNNDTITAIDGSITVGTDLTVPGVLTYEDVTSVDAVGLSTFQNGIHVTSGSVGIGTDNPIMRLHVHGAANSVDSRIRLSSIEGSGLTIRAQSATENNINADSGEDITFSRGNVESLRINSSGNIGIGTDNPQHNLHLYNNGDATLFIQADADNVDEDHNPKISMYQDGLTSSIFDLGINGTAGDAFTGALANTAYLYSVSNASSNGLQFATNGAARMYIDNSGKIGIGTNDPDKTMSIYSDQSVMLQLEGSTNTARIGFKVPGTTNPPTIGVSDVNDIQFRTDGLERLRISSNGVLKHGAVSIKTWTDAGAANGVTETKNLIAFNTSNNNRVYGEITVWAARSGLAQQRGYIKYAIGMSVYGGSYYGFITETQRTGVTGFSTLVIERNGDNIRLRHVGSTAASGASMTIMFTGSFAGGVSFYD